MTAHTVDEALDRFTLVAGSGDRGRTACAMTAISWIAGEAWSDHPACAHWLLADLVIRVNDAPDTTPEQRAAIVRAGEQALLDCSSGTGCGGRLMRSLAPTHNGIAPEPVEPVEPGTRTLDPEGLPVSLPSDRFCGRECITRDEWLRRHGRTYGPSPAGGGTDHPRSDRTRRGDLDALTGPSPASSSPAAGTPITEAGERDD